MTIAITGPKQREPWRGAVVALLRFAIVVVIGLILLGLADNFLVDWLWFSAIGYSSVFWTTIGAEATVFFVVFVATAMILWANGWLAFSLARRRWAQLPAALSATPLNQFKLIRHWLPWPLVITCNAGLFAALVAWGELSNWYVFLELLYHVPYGANDPLYDKDIGFYLFSLPAYIAIKNWMLLALLLSALFAGAVYWLHDDIEYDAQRQSMSPIAIAHGSVLLGVFFAVKAWSYGLDRYLLLYGDNGVVVGASFTDVHVELPVLWLLIGLVDRRGARRVGKSLECVPTRLPVAAAALDLRRLLRAVRRGSRVVPAHIRQTKRAAAGEALHPNATSRSPSRRTISIRSRQSRFPPNRTLPSRHWRPTRRRSTISGCGTGSH